jgi:hypothetical protein
MANKSNTKKKKEKISLEESAKSVQKTIDKIKDHKWAEYRGVQKGTKRGSYQPREKGVIKNKNFITATCQECKQDFIYKRKGKRLKVYCSDKCRQKHYRTTKRQKYLDAQQNWRVD